MREGGWVGRTERVAKASTGRAHFTSMPSLPKRVLGHGWTVARAMQPLVQPMSAPASRMLEIEIDDPKLGPLSLDARLSELPGSRRLAIIVHGLGGDANSPYCIRLASALQAAGWSSLRLSLRGADLGGRDLYHAGLVDDLHAVVRSIDRERHPVLAMIGFSLGGHLVLRYGLNPDPGVEALASVCAPLDLELSCRAIDRRRAFVYRSVILDSLKRTYQRVTRAGAGLAPLELVRRVRTIRQWDQLVVAPRHGFESAEHYYASMSVGPHLHHLSVPSLWVGSAHDPMVPEFTVAPSLVRAGPLLEVRMLDVGGHVGFPGRVPLGEQEGPLEERLIHWLESKVS